MAKKEKTPKELAVVESVPIADNSAERLIQQAIVNKVDVGTMERLLAMRTQIKGEVAREAFNKSMADFQSECPTIVKTKAVFTKDNRVAYRYAPIESIVSQVKAIIQKYGFSYSFHQELKEKGVKVSCVVVHEQGHSEEYSMEVPFGSKTQIMSDSQVTAAASTFAKRYAFCNAFGILTGDEDTDGATFDKSEVKDDAVPTVTYDDETPAPKVVAPKPVVVKHAIAKPLNKTDERRREIKDLVDAIVLEPLEQTEGAYKTYVKGQTGLELEVWNYAEIINRLKNLNKSDAATT